METRQGQHRGELCWPRPVRGPLAARLGPLPHNCQRSPIEVVLSAEVRLHALVGKKDGHAFTPNEEMKLDYQDRFITRTCQEWF